jgi:tRNA threonylcarbamoyladenosine biosynthesis protein TsaB
MWLGIDAATDYLSLALWQAGAPVAHIGMRCQETQAEDVFTLLEFLMRQNRLTPDALIGVGVARGPGSFTGVRVGLSLAKTVGQMLGIPVHPVDTLDALAWGCEGAEWVAPMLDARRGAVFGALYRRGGDSWETVLGGRLIAVEDWLDLVDATVPQGAVTSVVGAGLNRHREAVTARDPSRWHSASGIGSAALALAVAKLAEQRGQADWMVDAEGLSALYLREPQAVIDWERRQREGGRLV